MYYIPNIVIAGYGKEQVFQLQCLRCKASYFNLEEVRGLEDLFCEDCQPNEKLLKLENLDETNHVGNIKGWILKSDARLIRSRYNYNKVYKRDGYTCQYCGYSPFIHTAFIPLHIDHVRPFSSGGSNRMENMVVACAKCNRFIQNKWFENFAQKKEYILEHRKLNLT